METLKKYSVWGVVALIVIIGGYMLVHKASNTTLPPTGDMASSTPTGLATSTDTTSTTEGNTSSNTQGNAGAHTQFPINKSDAIASWNFKGKYTGNITLETQANADIDKLTKLLGKGTYDDYDLYNGIANDYTALGNGTMAYHDYNLAIAIHPSKGLAYMNLGQLMDELGAHATAIDAYAKSVALEPTQTVYWLAYLNFLSQNEPNATLTGTTFSKAITATNAAPDVLIAEANWLENVGRISDAISVWKKVRPNVSAQQQAAIDTKISQLQAKQ